MKEPKAWKAGDVVRCLEEIKYVCDKGAEVVLTQDCYISPIAGGRCIKFDNTNRGWYADNFQFVRSAKEAQYSRLKMVMTPEAAKSFQKPRCADCGKQLQSDDNSRETAEGALCEECLEGRGGGAECRAKPVCACCTRHEYGSILLEDGQEAIRHEDPCQFSHTERWMLPKAKAMFRERQLVLLHEQHWRAQRKAELAALTAHELKYGDNSARSYPDKYNLLTKGRCGA